MSRPIEALRFSRGSENLAATEAPPLTDSTRPTPSCLKASTFYGELVLVCMCCVMLLCLFVVCAGFVLFSVVLCCFVLFCCCFVVLFVVVLC